MWKFHCCAGHFPPSCKSLRRRSAEGVDFSILFFFRSLHPQKKCREKHILIAAPLPIRGFMREEFRVTWPVARGSSGVGGIVMACRGRCD